MSRPLPPLLLVRHGRTEWNQLGRVQGTTDVPLDSVGHAQADCLARTLADLPLVRIYSSPLVRAQATAERIRASQRHGPKLVILDDLRELSYGLCQGKAPGQWAIVDPHLERRWRTEPWRTRFPNGESFSRLLRRADRAIGRVRKDTVDPDSPILIVAHGHILRAIVLHLRTWPVERFWSIDIPNGSILATSSDILFMATAQLTDPKDDAVLELAVAADRASIVTYNVNHFRGAERFGVEILTPVQVLTQIGALE